MGAIPYPATELIIDKLNIIGSLDDNKSLSEIFKASFTLPTLVVLIGFLLIGFLIYKQRYQIDKFLTSTRLFAFAVVIFIVGLVVYTVGSLQSDQMGIWDALYTIPGAIISSLGMFIYQDDISELSDAAKHNNTFMAIYSLVHLAAALITAVVLIRLIIMRIYYWLKLQVEIHKSGRDNYRIDNLYLFWGINPRSVSLAESIAKQKKRGNVRLVFVDTVIEESNDVVGVNVSRLFDFIKIKREAERRLKAIGALIATCHGDLANDNNAKGADLYSMFLEMELSPLVKLVNKSKHLHVFFLSNDEDNNISSLENTITLAENTKDFIGSKMSKKDIHLYCHARLSAKTRWAEIKDICNYGKNPRIHIIDSSYLSVFCLKDEVKHHPVSFVEIDAETATVTSTFRSMVIGFGETGQEALKFLYEFGAFVNKEGKKTQFHCTVIDKKASELEGLFYAQAPAMKELTDTEEEERDIRFLQCPIDSIAYWDTIKKEIEKGLNYLVISIDNEELAINTAINISTLAARWRETKPHWERHPSDRLSIYVRSYNNENYDRLNTIVETMGEKYGGIKLYVFGNIKDIFRYDIIIDNKHIKAAKHYHYTYAINTHEKIVIPELRKLNLTAKQRENKIMEYLWKKLHNESTQNIWDIEEIERKRDQNISNALHAVTKMYLLKVARGSKRYWKKLDLEREKLKVYDDKDKPWKFRYIWTPTYTNIKSKDDIAILHNLARLEHERWIAASLMQGQQLAKKKDVQHKKHTDLVPWSQIRVDKGEKNQAETQGYDCAVVDTTIALS